jgi:hypothetical protein
MSTYEWEQGKFTIPSAEWPRVKKEIRAKINEDITRCFALAEKAHKHVTDKRPKLKGHAAVSAASDFLYSLSYPRLSDSAVRFIVDGLFPQSVYDGGSIARPTKKAFALHKSNVEYISDSDCSMRFQNDTRSIEWAVQENNHACETARAGVIGKALFQVLGTVKWTRGTGGTVWGNDEYNVDAGRENHGAGGSYQKDSFGPDRKPKPSVSCTPGSPFRFR